jgi:hypothetical protein
MDAKYGEMCGLTEEETVRCFPDYIADTAKATGNTPESLLERMRDYYDGFCFDGVHRLYNPFSTLCFFDKQEFRNFWMKSGTSKLIADYMKTEKLTVEQFRNFSISKDFADEPGELDSTPPEGFLYQGGYLTIREEKEEEYILDYPNREVLNAMSALLARNILSADKSFEDLRTLLLTALSKKNIKTLTVALNALLANIPYDDFATAGEIRAMINDYAFTAREWLYRSSILAFLRGCGVVVSAEAHTNLGRSDLVVRYGGNTFVMELKVAYEPEKVHAKLVEAEKQMIGKNYPVPYPGATGLVLVIDDTKRLIAESKVITSEEQQSSLN